MKELVGGQVPVEGDIEPNAGNASDSETEHLDAPSEHTSGLLPDSELNGLGLPHDGSLSAFHNPRLSHKRARVENSDGDQDCSKTDIVSGMLTNLQEGFASGDEETRRRPECKSTVTARAPLATSQRLPVASFEPLQ